MTDQKDKALLEQVHQSHKTGIATMTTDEWRWRATMVRLDAAADDAGLKLRRALFELGFEDNGNSYSALGATFADLMGVSAATVDKWCVTGKVPHYALAYIELARVLKAAQGPVQAHAAARARGSKIAPVSEPSPPAVGGLLPKMPLPPHLRRE